MRYRSFAIKQERCYARAINNHQPFAVGKTAIAGWLANKGVDFARGKVTRFAKDRAIEYGKSQLAQFRENAKLHLRQADRSVPKALRLAYLQATLQICALRSDELGANFTSYSQYLTSKLLRWKKRYEESSGVLAQAEVLWLDNLHTWLRWEIDKAKSGKLPALDITDQDFAGLVPFEGRRWQDRLITCPAIGANYLG